ncbi:ParA family protein [Marinoscillum sp.]|uniref:ParA family protein n=1 Tax=Marinoscillum sp. TaxID=2024838 RepID=UPI003BABF53F
MTIAVVNQKGGTGKTTSTINLGKSLEEKGKRVMLVDMDPQGSLGYSLGIVDKDKTIAELLYGEADLSEVIVSREGMDVIPSSVTLADVELSLVDAENREFRLKEILEQLTGYDYIFIDCPPSLSMLTVNALTASQYVLIPMLMEVLSLQGLDLISETLAKVKKSLNPELSVLGILPVMVDRRRKLSSEVFDHIQSNYDFKLFDTQIRPNVRASEAPSFGQSVITYSPGSNSANDYLELSEEFLKLV